MKYHFILFFLFLSFNSEAAPVKFSDLPVSPGSSTVGADSFVFVNTQQGNFTYRMLMGDLPSVPSVAAAFSLKASLTGASFTGNVAAPSFQAIHPQGSWGLTGNFRNQSSDSSVVIGGIQNSLLIGEYTGQLRVLNDSVVPDTFSVVGFANWTGYNSAAIYSKNSDLVENYGDLHFLTRAVDGYLDRMVLNETSASFLVPISGTSANFSGPINSVAKTQSFDNLSPGTSKGDIIVHTGTNNIRMSRCPDDQFFVADSAETTGWKCVTAAGNDIQKPTSGSTFINSTPPINLTGAYVTAIGPNSMDGGQDLAHSVGIGGYAGYQVISGHSNVFLGYGSGANVASSQRNTFIGYGTGSGTTSVERSTAIGAGATTEASGAISIGSGMATAGLSSVAIGVNLIDSNTGRSGPFADKQLSIGSTWKPINDVYLGMGAQIFEPNTTTVQNVSLQPTPQPSAGTVGANLTILAGKGYNTNNGGSLLFKVHPSGVETTAFTIDSNAQSIFSGGISYKTDLVTSGSSYVAPSNSHIVIVNKSSGSATSVTLPSAAAGRIIVIKDGKGDAASNAITIVPASGTIDGSANYVINSNYGFVQVVYNGTQWNIIAK